MLKPKSLRTGSLCSVTWEQQEEGPSGALTFPQHPTVAQVSWAGIRCLSDSAPAHLDAPRPLGTLSLQHSVTAEAIGTEFLSIPFQSSRFRSRTTSP